MFTPVAAPNSVIMVQGSIYIYKQISNKYISVTYIGKNILRIDVIFIIFLLIYIGNPSLMTAGKG